MKALSIQQPWAWLIVNGYKPVENRNWRTEYRGPLLIHAGKKFDQEGYTWALSNFRELDDVLPWGPALERGGIVGRANLVDCVRAHDSPWFFGPYGFVFEDAEPVPFEPCRGRLGFFTPERTEAP